MECLTSKRDVEEHDGIAGLIEIVNIVICHVGISDRILALFTVAEPVTRYEVWVRLCRQVKRPRNTALHVIILVRKAVGVP